MEFAFFMARASHMGKETALASVTDNILSNWPSRMQKKVTIGDQAIPITVKGRYPGYLWL